MSFQCPTCGHDVATRVLADSVTLIVVGRCSDHGMQELSRVYVGEMPAYPEEPAFADDSRFAPAEVVAYKPGSCCGRRIDDARWCQLPIGHGEEHAA